MGIYEQYKYMIHQNLETQRVYVSRQIFENHKRNSNYVILEYQRLNMNRILFETQKRYVDST